MFIKRERKTFKELLPPFRERVRMQTFGGMKALMQCIVVIQGQGSDFCRRCSQGGGAQAPLFSQTWVREWSLMPSLRAEVWDMCWCHSYWGAVSSGPLTEPGHLCTHGRLLNDHRSPLTMTLSQHPTVDHGPAPTPPYWEILVASILTGYQVITHA